LIHFYKRFDNEFVFKLRTTTVMKKEKFWLTVDNEEKGPVVQEKGVS